jgi:uncharacterized protein (DUF58 family)
MPGGIGLPPSLSSTPAPEVLRRLELTITRRLDGMLQGDYRGLVPGHGSELGETRPYQPGDDVRRIDWNVTARTQDPHVRVTIADRELETWALVDASASLRFGTARCEKRDMALAAVAAVGFLTQRTGNRVGAMLLEGDHSAIVPARGGRAHLQALLRRTHAALVDGEARPTALAPGLRRLGGSMRRRGLAVVVSDFLDDSDWEREIRALATRHEVLAVEVLDPRELEIPDIGVVDLIDPETGALLEIQTASGDVRRRFAEAAAEQRSAIGAALRRAGADHLVLRTDHDWLVELARFVTSRRERIDALTRSRP